MHEVKQIATTSTDLSPLAEQAFVNPDGTEAQPPSLETYFVEIHDAVGELRVSGSPTIMSSLSALIPHWREALANSGSIFAIPGHTCRPDNTSLADRRVRVLPVDYGCGRGISQVQPPNLLDQLALFDEFGHCFSRITAKGNGPTANEQWFLHYASMLAQHRISDNTNPWGLCFEDTATQIEHPTLSQLAELGFRVGRVLGWIPLDPPALSNIIDPYYVNTKYSVAAELAKAPKRKPCILLRIGGGPRANVLLSQRLTAEILREPIRNLALEVQVGPRSTHLFIEKNRIPKELEWTVVALAQLPAEQSFESTALKDFLLAYLHLISFLCWRNFFLQQEYNSRFPLDTKEIAAFARRHEMPLTEELLNAQVGPIWLNTKPGDWDTAGYQFDVDMFHIKLKDALEKGVDWNIANDRHTLHRGLMMIANKINQSFPELKTNDVPMYAYELAAKTSQSSGFLGSDVKKAKFYTCDV